MSYLAIGQMQQNPPLRSRITACCAQEALPILSRPRTTSCGRCASPGWGEGMGLCGRCGDPGRGHRTPPTQEWIRQSSPMR